MSIRRAEPRFDLDFKYGREAELKVAEFLRSISNKDGKVEVKRKRYLDLDFYVETHCDKGRTGRYQPSGISVSTAETYAFVIEETNICVLIPTVELKAMLDDPSSRVRSENDGTCPTQGKLVNLGTLLYRHKQRQQQGQSTQRPGCIHLPEYIENGVCRICNYQRIA